MGGPSRASPLAELQALSARHLRLAYRHDCVPHDRIAPRCTRLVIPVFALARPRRYDVLYQLGYANHSSYWLPGHNAGRLCWLDMPCVGVHDLTVLAIWSVCGVLSCFLLLRFCVRDPH